MTREKDALNLVLDAKTKAALEALVKGETKGLEPGVLVALLESAEKARKELREREEKEAAAKVATVKGKVEALTEAIRKEWAGMTAYTLRVEGEELGLVVKRGEEKVLSIGKGGKSKEERRAARKERREKRKAAKAAAEAEAAKGKAA